MVSSLAVLALAYGALALKVTSPDANTVWSTSGGKQTIKWESVSSDQSTFDIYLSNKVTYPPSDILLASDVKTSSGSHEVDSSKLSAGHAFTINFTNGTKTDQLYAQSNQFNITEGSSSSTASTAASGSSTAASSTGADSTATASSTGTATTTATATSTGASTDKTTAAGTAAASATTTSAPGSGAGKVVAGWVGVAALAALAL